MRGGFVACLGDHLGTVERAAGRLRWHRGSLAHHRCKGLEVIALSDPSHGPDVDVGPDSLILVHGAPADSLTTLQSACGRFASLHWDGAVLRASRDPLGLAPLFYRIVDGAIWLATEIHALLELEPDQAKLEVLSARAAFAPLDEETGWEGIRRVLPGCTLEIDPAFRLTTRRYWDPGRGFGTYRGSRKDAVGELRQRFRDAVKRCYGPRTGIVLSGGQDSGAVAVSVPEGMGNPHLVHVHFPSVPVTHEQGYAEAIARGVGAPLHRVAGELSPWDIGAELEMHSAPYSWLPYGIDEAVLTHLQRAGIEVALDGHDGDGVLGPRGAVWGSLVSEAAFGRLGSLCLQHGPNVVARGVASDFLPPRWRPRRYAFNRTYQQTVSGFLADDLRSSALAADFYRWDWPSRLWRARQIHPLTPRATISYEHKELEAARQGIDMRHPFADRDLVEFMISLPCAVKADPIRIKSLLIDAMGEDLPTLIRERPKSDYMATVRQRVDPSRCLEVIRSCGVHLPGIDYRNLFEAGDADPNGIPLYFLVNLTRVHEFARRAH